MNSRWIEPIALLGKQVTLEPMDLRHVKGLQGAARDGQLWKRWYSGVPSPEHTELYVRTALEKRDRNGELPFVIHEHKTNKVIGSTRFLNVDEPNQRLEIGCSWYAESYQRSAIDCETSLLLLTHAFEQLSSIAVEFRTYWIDQQARQAIEALGAKQDGVLRNHAKLAGGGYHDTVVYSIIESEWPMVKRQLQFLLR